MVLFSFQWQGGGTMLMSSIGPWYCFHFSDRVAGPCSRQV